MIKHNVTFYKKGFFLNWEIKLPFRLMKDDSVDSELLDRSGKLLYDKDYPDDWVNIMGEYLIVDYVQIDHLGNICVSLDIDKN